MNAEQIVDGLRKHARQEILRIVKRTESKNIKALLSLICPIPEHEAMNLAFIKEMIQEGLLKTTASHNLVMLTPSGEEAAKHIPDGPPRVLKHEEAKQRFIKQLVGIAKEWHRYKDKTEWEKMEGTIFSILCMIDGCTVGEPSFDLSACQDEDDILYLRDHGQDWYPIDEPFNDGSMHEMFHEIVKEMRPES